MTPVCQIQVRVLSVRVHVRACVCVCVSMCVRVRVTGAGIDIVDIGMAADVGKFCSKVQSWTDILQMSCATE
jgi:hypothetical protein